VVCVMDGVLDLREEARACLHLAEVEADPDVRTILMGMALGWLTFASEADAAPEDEDEHLAELD
jgi:hypothetical protein